MFVTDKGASLSLALFLFILKLNLTDQHLSGKKFSCEAFLLYLVPLLFFLPYFCGRPNNDLLELVWEKGQISVQGQFSRARVSPNCKTLPSHCLPSHTPIGYANNAISTNTRMGKCGNLGVELNEIRRLVPSGEVDLSGEFMAVMHEMIRKEVRSYMEQQKNGMMCFQGMEMMEGFRNVSVKRIGISRVDS